MTRRTAERHPRRIEVRFWRRGNPQPHSGFTIDLSRTGLFLGTAVSLTPGERIRLEVLDRANGFFIEGEVARVHKVMLALRHVQQPGVGVRFLQPRELVGAVLGAERSRPGTLEPLTLAEGARTGGAAEPSRVAPGPKPLVADPVEPPPVRVVARPAPIAEPSRPSTPSTHSGLDPATQADLDELFGEPPAAGAAGGEGRAKAPPAKPDPALARDQKIVPVEFVDRSSFLAVYSRDISAGGLFVTTTELPDLHARVTVEIRPPVATPHALRFEAKVVHRFDGGSGAKSELTGIGVQFFDPERVRAALEPVLAELRR